MIENVLIPSVICLAVLLTPVLFMVGRKSSRQLALVFVAAIGVLGLCVTPFVFFASAAVFVVLAVCVVLGARPRHIRWVVTVAAILGGGVTFVPQWQHLSEVRSLRKIHAPESVAARLQYEEASQSRESVESVLLTEKVRQRLEASDRDVYSYRVRHLSMLHDEYYDDFIMQNGFGVVRMRRINPRAIQLIEPDSGPIPLPDAPFQPPPYPTSKPRLADVGRTSVDSAPTERTDFYSSGPTTDVLDSLHATGAALFLEPDRLGYVRDRNFVVGFESHGIRQPLEFASVSDDGAAAGRWQVTRVELVSLLKHDEPVAYTSDHLPTMDELSEAPTRPLDSFESGALRKVRTDEDVVIDDGVNEIRMLGALRAREKCNECHRTQWGELLGAFSYTLHRVTPVAGVEKTESINVR